MTDVRQPSQMGRLVREACDRGRDGAVRRCLPLRRCSGRCDGPGERPWLQRLAGDRGRGKSVPEGCWARVVVLMEGEYSQLASVQSSGASTRFAIAALSVGSPPAATPT
jgi:hypothetical protein